MSCILGCNSTHFGPGEDEKQVDIAVQSVEESLVIFGQITDCAKNNQPVVGALVKVFKCVDRKLVGICHTFTGGNGYYMLNLPKVNPHEKIVVMATCGCLSANVCSTCTPDCQTPPPCGNPHNYPPHGYHTGY